jgi:hypothetical protein
MGLHRGRQSVDHGGGGNADRGGVVALVEIVFVFLFVDMFEVGLPRRPDAVADVASICNKLRRPALRPGDSCAGRG